MNSIPKCSHSTHLFFNPLCSSQSVLKKISNVAFIALALIVIYLAVRKTFFPNSSSLTASQQSTPSTPAVNPVPSLIVVTKESVNEDDLSDLGKKYLFKAREIIISSAFSAKDSQCNNFVRKPPEEICKLSLLLDMKWVEINAFIKTKGPAQLSNPQPVYVDHWNDPKFLEIFDDYMAVSFAISFLTLKELPNFIKDNPYEEKRKNTTAIGLALFRQDSYQYRTYYTFPKAYFIARGYLGFRQADQNSEYEARYFAPWLEEIPESYRALFSSKETAQYKYKQLYEEYRSLVLNLITIENLKNADNRLASWIKEDRDIKRIPPDTLPT